MRLPRVRFDPRSFLRPRRRDAVARVALPPIARRLAWTEWLLVAACWLLAALTSVGTLTDRARQAGIAVIYRDYLVFQVVDWIAWMALLWPLFAVLDATPLASPRRGRHLLARGAAWLTVAAAHTAIAYPAVLALAGPLRLDPAVWRLSVASPAGMLLDDVFNVGVAFTAYAVLRRVHRRRLELARAADLERSLLRARLHALDLQLQPHFLFNTLNAITALVRADPEQAERMLVTLGDLLRTTLGRTGEEVTVAEELDQLDLYLDLQRARFGDRVGIQVEVDAEALPAYVPGMILQPLVENALTHGLAPKTTAGTLRIAVVREGETVVLRVSDDGVGLPPGGPRERTGVGNTRVRLRALYGSAQGCALVALPGGGALSEVRLPFRTAPTSTAEFPIGTGVEPAASPALPAPRRTVSPVGAG